MIAPHPTEDKVRVRVRVRHSFTEVKVRVRVRVRHSKLMAKHCRARLVNKERESQTSDVSACTSEWLSSPSGGDWCVVNDKTSALTMNVLSYPNVL